MSIPYEWSEIECEAGSDGINRNLAEWYEFILGLIDKEYDPDDGSLEGQIKKAKSEVGWFFQNEGSFEAADTNWPNLKSFIGDAVQEYFRLAIKNAYETGHNDAIRLKRLVHHMRSFTNRLSSLNRRDQTIAVGQALICYIEAYERMPSQPSELEKFTNNHEKWKEWDKIPRRTIADALYHYKLENVVRGNRQG
jgi:hypothetical protein